jgi:hypothetical protein
MGTPMITYGQYGNVKLASGTGEVPAGRVKGRTIKWVSKSRGREQLSIQWELGIRDDGYVPGQVTYAVISSQ